MENLFELLRDNAVLIVTLVVAVVFPLLLRAFGKKAQAERWALALPHIYQAVLDFVQRADQLHDEILVEYADEAAATGDDPRLLWVIDRVEEFAQKTFRVSVDLNWVIDQVELYLASRRAEEEDEYDETLDIVSGNGVRASIVE